MPLAEFAAAKKQRKNVITALKAEEIEFDEDAVNQAIDELYEAYDTKGVTPTKELLADKLEAGKSTVAEALRNLKDDPFRLRTKRTKRIAIIVAVCVLLLAIGGVGLVVSGAFSPATNTSETSEQSVPTQAAESDDEKVELVLRVDLDGWNRNTSTPVIAHIVSEDGSVDFYHAFDANTDETILVALTGAYRISYISPINADGSIYDIPSATTTIQAGSGVHAETFEKVDADKVTQEEVDDILDQIKDAVTNGDDTLKGDAGKDIIDNAANNAAAAPNVDADKTTEKAEEVKNETTSNNDKDSSTGSNTSTNSNATTNNTSTNSGTSSGTSSNNSAQTHTHTWVAQTTQQWVQDSAAWDETVPVYSTKEVAICAGCGADITADPYSHFTRSGCVNGSSASNWRYETQQYQSGTEVIHHEATGHYETVTTGYVCSGCGATK